MGLERAANLEQLTQLEFGRGFTYNRPLSLNLLDLDYELAEQLVGSRVATAGDPPRRLSPRGLHLSPRGLCLSPWGPPLRLRPLRRSYALLGRLLRLELVFRFDRTTWPRRLAVACPASAPDKEGTADPSAASGPRCSGLALSSCPRLDFRGGSRPGAGRSLSCYCTETGWGGPGARRAAGGEAGVHMPMPFSRPRGGEPRLQRRTSGPRERV